MGAVVSGLVVGGQWGCRHCHSLHLFLHFLPATAQVGR
jgi:hypothetical protein